MQAPPFPDDFIVRKTSFGAHLVINHDCSLSAIQRRLLVLADGKRTLFTLCQLMPDRDLASVLTELIERGAVEGDTQVIAAPAKTDVFSEADLPSGWENASGFMMDRARESLGVMAVDVIEAIESAKDQESVRQAMSQWYRAMRSSRNGKGNADVDRVIAARLLGQPGASAEP